ncbi:DUF3558 domain-containing protein [Rhodococcus sp. DMU2021]|uniref:DUF3558 domain-containing protein n=1 Tax=Rhodococcus sp. DMU2021 TaxID=2866997 RepID=UPI001C7D215D|nr:DUF3558 domain-containing protein [Rhodococcus sp. DMU2021]MBX4167726.1 DUF3558 domain-containing protein [Rhodococcus sp. DMU2021]
MGRWGIVALAALAVMGTACSPGSADDVAVGDETATTTTRTPRITDDSGRPPVTFDPCYDIPDDVMNAAGYDAAKKEIADMPMGTYTFLGCAYEGTISIPGVLARYDLLVLAGNVTLDEELKRNGHVAESVQIDGRPALVEVNPNARDTCRYVLQTTFGIVGLSRIYHKDHPGAVPQDEWCAGVLDLATTLEPFIQD